MSAHDGGDRKPATAGNPPRRARRPAPQRRPRAKGGALICLTVLLAGSAALRLSEGADDGALLARQFVGAAQAEETTPGCAPGEDNAAVLAALDERARRLDEREAAIEARSATLAEAEAEIERNMAELVSAERELAATMAIAEEAAENDLSRLVAVYESMKPAQAAALFAEMEPDFAAGFIGRMRPEAAAQVMAGLPAGSAYALSVVMAGRNANVPTE